MEAFPLEAHRGLGLDRDDVMAKLRQPSRVPLRTRSHVKNQSGRGRQQFVDPGMNGGRIDRLAGRGGGGGGGVTIVPGDGLGTKVMNKFTLSSSFRPLPFG